MFRRSRFSVRPNVRPNAAERGGGGGEGGSSGGSSVPAPAGDGEGQPGFSESRRPLCCPLAAPCSAAGDVQAGRDDGNSSSRSEKPSSVSREKDGDKCAETLLQRRKRISTVPNLAKPRVTTPPVQRPVNLASKAPPKQVSHSSTIGSSPPQKESPSSEKANLESSPKSPPVLPEKKTPVPQVPQFSPFKKSTSKEPNAHATIHRSDEALEKSTSTPLKERPTQEKALQEEVSQVQSKSAPVRERNTCSDKEKIIKTKTLRKMLKEELKKEKEQRKSKFPIIEKTMPEDRSKMTMRDFIYYLPENNPMKSSLVEEKRKEKTSTVTQSKEPEERVVADHVDENEEEDDDEEEVEDDGPLLVPRVKVAEDGSIILDEESLTVEVLRTKGQCVVEENDPIFERGSTTTYSSFRRSYYTKPWSEKETEMFFLAISMVGTDFSMISQLFPHRARTEIKNKFKREEKANGWRIDKAFKEKRPFDFNFFAKLLEKVLEIERMRKEKDAKCQHQREKILNEKHKSQKKQQEMEVDVGTAEKENEEAPSILEQMEGPTVPESGVTKKKRKRKKKDSDHEMETLPEETAVPAEVAEGEKSRKKRKNISAIETNGINEAGEELNVPDGVTPDGTLPMVEENPPCYILDEEPEGGDASSVHESGEADALEAISGRQTEEPSESPEPSKEDIEGATATQGVVTELDKLDENQTIALPCSEDKIRETEAAITEKPTLEEQQQIITTDLTRAEEKRECLTGEKLEAEISPSESMSFEEKSTAEESAPDITGPILEETCRTNNDMESESRQTENAPGQKMDGRSHRLRPKPNIMKASCRKEARVQSKLNSLPDESERKNTAQEEIHSISPGGTPGKDCHISNAPLLTAKKPTFQESSKQPILKPASLARGWMQRPKPNLGRLVRGHGGLSKHTETEEQKGTEAAVETEKTLTQPDCNSNELLSKNAIEAHTYEVDTTPSEELDNKTVASAEPGDSVKTSPSPVSKPLECENHKLQTTSLSSSSLDNVANLSARDSNLQEQKEFLTETEESLEIYAPIPNQSLGKEAEEGDPLQIGNEGLDNKHKTEMAEESLININRECKKFSNLDEEAHCRIESPMDNQEAVITSKPFQSPTNSLACKNGEQSEVLLSADIQKNISVGSASKENSQGVSKPSVVRPVLLLRSRFQKPRPNIGRAVGRKEVQSVEGNEATGAVSAAERAELRKPHAIGTPTGVTSSPQIGPADALEKKSADSEKKNPEDSQVPCTSLSISDQRLREKPAVQEGKLSVIKPAQLVRGRFQRARPSLGRLHGKKEEAVSENINAPVEKEVGKQSVEIFKKDDLNPPSKDEVGVQVSLDHLEKKDESESSEDTLPKRCSDQKTISSTENSQGCVLLIHQEEACMSKDDEEGKHVDIPESGISAVHDISHLKNTKPVQPTRSHFQKPKPNVTRTSEKKEPVSSEDASTQGMAGRDIESDAIPSGSTSGNMSPLIQVSQNVVEVASMAKSLKQKTCPDSIGTAYLKRTKDSGRPISEQSSGSESQIKKTSKPDSVQEKRSKGKQPVRTLKRKKTSDDSRTFCASECERDLGRKGKHDQKSKTKASRGKSLKPAFHKKPRKEYGSAKVSLVTLRASSQEDDDDDDDDDDGDDFELDYEVECFSPEEVNKAPVFVPKGLRSPNPVPVQIEETMEELEIYENVVDDSCLSHELHVDAQPVVQEVNQLYSSHVVFIQEEQKEKTGISDGSTEAAMTLLAMRDPVFQLNIGAQENSQVHGNKEELNIADGLHIEHYENIVPCNVSCSAPSKNEPVPSDNMNRSTVQDCTTESSRTRYHLQEEIDVPLLPSSKTELVSSCSTSGLEEGSPEKSKSNSDLPVSKGNSIPRMARCRFPKPKPNLYRALGLKRNAPQRSPGLSAGEEQFNETKKDKEVSSSSTEKQKVQLEVNIKSAEVAESSFEEKHDLLPGCAGRAAQKNKTEREDPVKETWEVALELMTPKDSPEAETCLSELPRNPNANMDVQVFGVDEHQLAAGDVTEAEAVKQPNVSVTRVMTAVSLKEGPTREEEPTFILTLVEIPADSEDGRGVPGSLEQTPAELLPAPVLFTSANADAVELIGQDSSGSVTATVDESAVSINSSTKREELQIQSSGKLTDLSLVALDNRKSCTVRHEGNCDPPRKKRPASSTEEDLENSNKESSPKLRCIPKQAEEENSEKLNISMKKIASSFSSVPELCVKEKEHAQTSIHLGDVLFGEATVSDEKMSRTLHVGKAETTRKQRNHTDTCKSGQSEQARSTEVLPKTPFSRSNQRSFGFLPLICKDNADEEATIKPSKGLHQETDIIVSQCATKDPVLSRDDKEEPQESTSLSSAIPASFKCEKGSSSTVLVSSELSDSEGSSKQQEKEEEPTKISEYFFGDIFMEVDDSE